MIIVGDIASPTLEHSENLKRILDQNSSIFEEQLTLINLEGMIADDLSLATSSPVLFNHSSVLNAFPKNCTLVTALANNHILDLPEKYNNTIQKLKDYDIPFFGAGKTKSEAQIAIEVTEKGKKIVMINACWDFLLYHQNNPSKGIHVNTINEQAILKQVISVKKDNPEAAVIVYFHWSFDLEILPFPLYRQFAKDLIDSGVNLVVGTHSHCVQGGESYKEGYIVYGLGNFYLPSNTFANGTLRFPAMSKTQLVLDWNAQTNKLICHWFDYSNENLIHNLEYLCSEDFHNSEYLLKYSPFQGMDHEKYIAYFKKKRRKKILIPVFKNYKKVFLNRFFTLTLKFRATILRKMAILGIIKWQN